MKTISKTIHLIFIAISLLSCTSKPLKPVIITSGFIIDSTLNDLNFSGYVKYENGYSAVERSKIDTTHIVILKEYGEIPYNYAHIYFDRDEHAGVGCQVMLTFKKILAESSKSADTIIIKGEVLIHTHSDILQDNKTYIPDSAYLALSHIPTFEFDSLAGYVYAYKKGWSDYCFEGAFMANDSTN